MFVRILLIVGPVLLAVPLLGGVIEGRVTNAVTGEGVSGATVRFLDRQNHSFTTSTEAGGAYRLTGVPDGEYHGEFSKEGFAEYRQDFPSFLSGSQWVHVAGDVPGRMDGKLQPWGSLRGRVLDEEGKPAAKVPVEISRSLENTVSTDERGEFVFEELAAGSYTVVAKPASTPSIRDGERIAAVPTYYPSVTQLAEASAIDVRWGADVAGIEIRLKSRPVRRVSGVVIDEQGKPVAQALVRLLGSASPVRQDLIGAISAPGPRRMQSLPTFHSIVAPGHEPEMANVESKEDGTFEFAAVQQGDWRVTADTLPDTHRPRSGVMPAFVADKDIEGIEIRLSTSFSVDVMADWGNLTPPKGREGGPIPTAYLVHLIPLEGQPQLDFNADGAVTSVNGAFPGRYLVTEFHAADAVYASTVTLGGKDVLGHVIDLYPGIGPFHISASGDAGIVRGAAENGEGATAFLIAKGPGELIDYQTTACGRGGAFEFRGVIPGDYYLVVLDRGGALPPAQLPDAIVPLASTVRVEAGSSGVPVNVRVNHWPW